MIPAQLIRQLAVKSLRQVAWVLVAVALAAALETVVGTAEAFVERRAVESLEPRGPTVMFSLLWLFSLLLGVSMWDHEHKIKTWGFHLTKPLARELLAGLTFVVGLGLLAVAVWVGAQVLPLLLGILPWPASWGPVRDKLLVPATFGELALFMLRCLPPFTTGFVAALWGTTPRSSFRYVSGLALLIAYYGMFVTPFEAWHVAWAAPLVFAVLSLGASFGLVKEIQVAQ
jgi:hypothetical protein